MTPALWQQIEEAFEDALARTGPERTAFLADLGARDPALHGEVLSLLASADDSDAVLRHAIEGSAAQTMTEASTSRIGGRLGAYRLVELLGEGGMGSVYRAERDDQEYRSEVAVKVLRYGLASGQAIARFRDERQILAALDHPNIVRLFDGGSTPDGVPYLVLEFVEGQPITRYAREQALGVEARVALFVQVCAAVAYAHQRLVVHRDLKPSNILVGERGVPKLLDFGIAKLLDPATEGERQALTRTGTALLTPEYASPEQARGEAISTATDVYSLGAVLYELLADRPPHLATANALEALRVVCEVEPPAPSTVAPRERRAAIAGDLDNIIHKALRKEASQRYASVEQLAADLRRYLDGQPVLARPATLGYRTRKLLRRHGGKIALATLVVAALVSSTVWSLREARRADRETARAERGFAEGRRLASALVFDIEARLHNLKGATAARELIVRSAARYLDGLAADASDDPALSRELATAYMHLGEIEGDSYAANLGRARDALISYDKAAAILDRMTTERATPATQRVRVLHLLGAGLTYHALGELPRAIELLRQGLALFEAMPPGEQPPLGTPLRSYMALVFLGADLDVAKRDLARGAALAGRWLTAEPTSPDARYWKALVTIADAELLGSSADPIGAVKDLNVAAALLQTLATEFPEEAHYARDFAVCHAFLAGYQGGIGGSVIWRPDIDDLDAAIVTARASVPLFEELMKRDPNDVRVRIDVGGQIASHAALVALRDPADAMPLFEQSLAVYDTLPQGARDEYYARQMEWFLHCAMATPLAKVGNRDAAFAHAARGLELTTLVTTDDKGNDTGAMCRFMVAEAHHVLGEDAAAVRMLETTVASLQHQVAKPSPTIGTVLGYVQTLERLAVFQPARACELSKRAADAWRAWRHRTAWVEEQQAAIDRRAACTP